MFNTYAWFDFKRRVSKSIVDTIDTIFTTIGCLLLIALLIVTFPFMVFDQLFGGN